MAVEAASPAWKVHREFGSVSLSANRHGSRAKVQTKPSTGTLFEALRPSLCLEASLGRNSLLTLLLSRAVCSRTSSPPGAISCHRPRMQDGIFSLKAAVPGEMAHYQPMNYQGEVRLNMSLDILHEALLHAVSVICGAARPKSTGIGAHLASVQL